MVADHCKAFPSLDNNDGRFASTYPCKDTFIQAGNIYPPLDPTDPPWRPCIDSGCFIHYIHSSLPSFFFPWLVYSGETLLN
ncbi:hypothetical protein GDO78_008013 [Eleutherodactylus coqui]|uniref:Uncharacterized protein n=1 Tax=Eleutherodactylus coqui TaxID=57060 RepID=A0A8J6KDC1_ELECQ|nr:hypothetical protein GDO78_008013 [Eleutherodactylus coqui]